MIPYRTEIILIVPVADFQLFSDFHAKDIANMIHIRSGDPNLLVTHLVRSHKKMLHRRFSPICYSDFLAVTQTHSPW